ncbi:MAG: insulinase family protein [Alphaproteobacteria bacterium]|nr:insulinase family protein [Alphaproteobacteria bacterium]
MRTSALLLLLCGCMPKIARGPVPVEVDAQPAHLVEQPDERAPNVYLQAVVRMGSASDPSGREGLAALTARAMVEAGAGERTGQEVRDALFEAGTGFELVVDRELASIRLKCHRDHADLCRELFTDVLTAPRFRDEDVKRLGEQALNAVTAGLTTNEERLGEEVFHGILYEAHPYGHPVRGRAGVLPLLDGAATRAFWEAHVRRSTVTVGVAGSYDGAWLSELKEGLLALPAGPGPELVLPSPNHPEGRGLVAVDTDTGVTGFHIGHDLAIDRNHPDWPALTVAMTAFGAHRQSYGRLYTVLRGDRGLNYGDYAYAEPFVQRGWTVLPEQGVRRRDNHLMVWLRPTSDENAAFAVKLAIDELEKLVADGLTEEELANTVAYLSRHTRLEATDPGRKLAYALDAEVSGTPDVLDYLPRAIADLDLGRVNAAIAQHVHPDDLWIVAVSGDAEGLAKRLIEETPTPIVYADVTPGEAQAARDAEVAKKSLGLDPEQVFVLQADGVFR